MTTRDPDDLILMEVKGLMIDPSSNNPIVILKDPESQAFLPIWIGLFEASAIQLGLEASESPRPRTHDLLATTMAALNSEVVKVVVADLRDQTFYATIYVQRAGSPRLSRSMLDPATRLPSLFALRLRYWSPLPSSRRQRWAMKASCMTSRNGFESYWRISTLMIWANMRCSPWRHVVNCCGFIYLGTLSAGRHEHAGSPG